MTCLFALFLSVDVREHRGCWENTWRANTPSSCQGCSPFQRQWLRSPVAAILGEPAQPTRGAPVEHLSAPLCGQDRGQLPARKAGRGHRCFPPKTTALRSVIRATPSPSPAPRRPPPPPSCIRCGDWPIAGKRKRRRRRRRLLRLVRLHSDCWHPSASGYHQGLSPSRPRSYSAGKTDTSEPRRGWGGVRSAGNLQGGITSRARC